MTDQFDGYRKLLKLAQTHKAKTKLHKALVQAGIGIHDSDPLPGYYRLSAHKGGPLLPIKIESDDFGVLTFRRDGQLVDRGGIWPICVWNPVTEEAYEAALRGEPWPDQAVIDQAQADPFEDEHDVFTRQISDLKTAAEKYAEIASQAQADQAQELRAKLTKLAGQADKEREALVRPHVKAQREINAKWNALINEGKSAADAIRRAIADFVRSQPVPESVPVPEVGTEREQIGGNSPPEGARLRAVPTETAPIAFKGSTGRGAKVVTKNIVEITDMDALYAHIKAVPDLKIAMQKIAERLVEAGQTPPGVGITQVRDVA